ncbi:MAG: winged helix-turn-helix domain-containing protein [Clostridiales bacterium]|nr:winged helix-turn-helix domain-containing protein [Clostridiales bacterium]
MKHRVLNGKNGEDITWKEAVIAAMEGLGRPATIQEIGDYMLAHVIVEYPDTAATPLQTIYRIIYTYTNDSPYDQGKEHIFYKANEGVWGLARWQGRE